MANKTDEQIALSDSIREYVQREGKCMTCDEHIDVQIRTYRRADGSEFTRRVRSRCDCMPEQETR